ncbi:MAG: acyl-homoserine-lactone synthase, partial [Pseudomonadales bacterium]
MHFTSGTPEVLKRGVVSKMAAYRHRVFIEKLGWQLDCESGQELDQFDREDTVYVVAEDDYGDVVGTARLLPTHRPYLLGEVFPQLMGGAPIPHSPAIWELSRFAAVDFSGHSPGPLGQFSSDLTLDLLRAAASVASSRGAERLITVSPIGIERLLRHTGFMAHRAGPPVAVDGHPILACWIELPGVLN